MKVKVLIAPSMVQAVAFEIEYVTNYINWKVTRSLDQLINLNSKIQKEISTPDLPSLPTTSDFACLTSPGIKEKLQEIIECFLNYLNQIPELWSKVFFTEFISDSDSLLKLFLMQDRTLHYCMKMQKENEQLKIEVKRANHSFDTLRNITQIQPQAPIIISSPSSLPNQIQSQPQTQLQYINNITSLTSTPVDSSDIVPVSSSVISVENEKSYDAWSTPEITISNNIIIPNNIQPTLIDKEITVYIYIYIFVLYYDNRI